MNIKELAEQAGYSKEFLEIGVPNNMQKFAELVAAAEREACAKLVEEVGRQTAAAIRARSKHD